MTASIRIARRNPMYNCRDRFADTNRMADLIPFLTFSIWTARLKLAVVGITCVVFGTNETSLYKITVI